MQIVTLTFPTTTVKHVPPPVRIGTRRLGPLSMGCRVLKTVLIGGLSAPSELSRTVTFTEVMTALRLLPDEAAVVCRASSKTALTGADTFSARARFPRFVTALLIRSWDAFVLRASAIWFPLWGHAGAEVRSGCRNELRLPAGQHREGLERTHVILAPVDPCPGRLVAGSNASGRRHAPPASHALPKEELGLRWGTMPRTEKWPSG